MKLLPKTLSGQLLGLLLVSLLLSHMLAQQVGGKKAGSIHSIALSYLCDAYAAAYRAMSLQHTGQEQIALLKALSTADFQLSMTDKAAPVHAMDEEEHAIAMTLNQKLAAGAVTSVQILHDDHQGRPGQVRIDISTRLPDGDRLNAAIHPLVRPVQWIPRGYGLSASIVIVLLAVAWFLRRILRPLQVLRQAAERISRGEKPPAFPLNGPSELRELAAAFNTMQERINHFVNDRTRLLAGISHDFRTPITALRIQTEMLEDARRRDSMRKTLDQMAQMVDETLQFARSDSMYEDTETVDLHTLLNQVKVDLEAIGHQIKGHIPAHMLLYRCRPLALIRALTNLINNAVQYGQAAEIAVEENADAIRITIDDNGPGLPPEWLEQVFSPFVRRADTTGTGLGLAIARSCIAAHGGHIVLSNRESGGLRASITLPKQARRQTPRM